MAWTTITAATLQRRMPADYAALQRAAESRRMDWDSTVAEVLADVVAQVRGYVAGYRNNTLGAEGSVPPECVAPTLSLTRLELISIIPGGVSLADELRRSQEKRAHEFLARVAKGEVAVSPPDDGAASAPDPASPKWSGEESVEWPDTPTLSS